MTLEQYIETINQRFRLGNATEHTFRGDLQHLLESLVTDIRATNEPKRQSCGAPDYIITRGEIPVGFIEAKDVGDKDLEGKKKTGNQEQFDRYKTGLANLIITDYIDFHFYRDGIFTTKISIGKVENGSIVPQPENYDQFTQLFKNFCETISQSIKSPTRLAEMMAGKARLMADIIEKSLNEDDDNGNLSNLKRQMLSFQKMLISDIDNKSFSDLYSQTIAYGMFAARYHDPTLQNFSREEAVKLIPKSNPFLRKLFKDIADEDLDTRLVWIIDELVNVFLASDVSSIMKNFGKSTKQEDPVVHFYETFLGAYNPALRKARGVWYTPQPVVNFIVRAVDDILKTEFDLPEGLADSSKKKIKVNYQGKQIEKEVHKVQILDPATGTGTFLAETIKHIHKKYEGMQGIWSKYVEDDLIPRVNGFELLMASYAMAHLKLDMLLTETGYVPTKDQRLRVFLTNSLEEPHPDSGTLWGNLLSDEADQANEVKRDTPVMCVIGNPPYSISSYNQSKYIDDLMSLYKVDVKDEKNIQLLSDDYAKFIRLCHHNIVKNKIGVIGLITKNTYLNVSAFKGMRKKILEDFDIVYILDLHGKMYEKCKDGIPNQNVFDIRVGTSIMFLIKNGTKTSKYAKLFFHEFNGNRESKYEKLSTSSLDDISWEELKIDEKYFFFEKKDFTNKESYLNGFEFEKLFKVFNSGIETGRDHFIIGNDKNELIERLTDFSESQLSTNELREKYNLNDQPKFNLNSVKNSFRNVEVNKVQKYSHKPFSSKVVYYDSLFLRRHSDRVMNQFFDINDNHMILLKKRFLDEEYHHCFYSNSMTDRNFLSGQTYCFPLYVYSNNNSINVFESSERIPNFNIEIIKQISEKIELTFTNEKETTKDTFAPIDILDYIYAVLHSPNYREKYKEFLKIDFPRVPYPKDKDTFRKLVKLGGEIRQIHLLESAVVEKPISKYPHTGTNVVGKTKYENGNVYINETQCFEDVPEVVWNFYIGGYQPAQKWLKDRKDRELQIDDIRHYMKIIVALTETHRLMKEIDKIDIE
jgi:predicted helicase